MKSSELALKLLIPVDADPCTRWPVNYALSLHQRGQLIQVAMLNVGEIPRGWHPLYGLQGGNVFTRQKARARKLIDKASAPFRDQGIPCRAFFHQGPIVRSILEFADEIDADQIVLPYQKSRWWKFFSRETVRGVALRDRAGRVVLVSADGSPCTKVKDESESLVAKESTT